MSAAYRAHFIVLWAAFALACGPVSLRAQPADAARLDSVIEVGEITVTAAREGILPARAAQRVVVLDRESIDATASRSVADLLDARSGLFIRRQGQGLATVSQRGGSPSQTQLLIDGLHLTDPQLGQFDLSLLPAHLFEAAEILHGPGSALYGADGMTGIVHLRARRGEGNRLSLSTEAGAFGERLASAGYAFDGGSLSGLVSAEVSSAEGDFPYLDRTLFPPQATRRRNADRLRRSLFATLQGRAGRHGLRGAFLYADARQGIPGLAGSPPHDERRWDEHARFWLEDRLPFGAAALNLRTFAHVGALRYRNPALDLDETGRTVTSGLEATIQAAAGRDVDFTVGAAAGYGAANHPSLRDAASDLHSGGFVSATARYGGFRLYPALRVDAYHMSGRTRSAASPRLGANVQVRPDVYFKLNAAEGFRIPTFNDRFWRPGGNPDLKPERSRSLDAGLYVDRRRVQAELTGFAARHVNQIVWTDEEAGYWAPKNLARTRSQGLEASLEVRPVHGISTGFAYSFTHAVDRSDTSAPSYGRQLRYVPRHLGKAHASLAVRAVRLDAWGQYLGARYVTSDETERMEAVVTTNVQISVAAALGYVRGRLSLVIENVLDTRYAVIQGYPMPPRHARVRLLLFAE